MNDSKPKSIEQPSYKIDQLEPEKIELMSDSSDTLLTFPCDFPLKAMGLARIDFLEEIAKVIQQYDPDFDPAGAEVRFSKNRNYVSITCMIHAQSKRQLDAIYIALSNHPFIKVVF